MSEIKELRLARYIKILLDVVYGALIFACIGLVLWIIFSPLFVSRMDILGTASVPVLIGSGESQQLEVTFTKSKDDAVQAAFVADAEGTLYLETRSLLLIFIANAAKLVVAIGLAYVFYLLRGVLQNILDGEPFASENAQRIRSLGYAILLLGLLRPLIEHITAREILNQIEISAPILNPGPSFNVEMIFISVLVLLLAYIWSYGLELEQDKALTV